MTGIGFGAGMGVVASSASSDSPLDTELLLGLGTVDSFHWAEAGITIVTGVSNWADQANSNDVANATGGEQPTIIETFGTNNRTALRFDGTDDYLDGAWARVMPYYGIVVCVPTRGGNTGKAVLDGSVVNKMLINTQSSTQMRFYGGQSINATSDIDAAQMITWQAIAGSGNSSIQINDETPVTGTSTEDANGLTVGANGSVANDCDTDVALIIIYTSITAPNLALAQAEINSYYALY
jgi:hypothetical protein